MVQVGRASLVSFNLDSGHSRDIVWRHKNHTPGLQIDTPDPITIISGSADARMVKMLKKYMFYMCFQYILKIRMFLYCFLMIYLKTLK